jgi:GxxExxY protein
LSSGLRRTGTAWRATATRHEPIPTETERFGKALLDAAFEVHTHLGAGFIERVYEDALCHELSLRQVPFERQVMIDVSYKGLCIRGQRLDLVVGGVVVAELKSVAGIEVIHQAQLLSYLKATKLRLGYIINFNVAHLRNGLKRMVV